MKYREAKKLKEGQVVVSLADNSQHSIQSIEVYGIVRFVRVNCQDGKSYLNEELKDYEQ